MRLAIRSLMSVKRASTSRCRADCGTGENSSLDTICVGTGEGKEDCFGGQQAADHFVCQVLHVTPPVGQPSWCP